MPRVGVPIPMHVRTSGPMVAQSTADRTACTDPLGRSLQLLIRSFRFRGPNGRSTEMATLASSAKTGGRKPLRARLASAPSIV